MFVVTGIGAAGRQVGGLLAEGSFTDPENARIIYLVAGGLLLMAVLLAVGTVWWWRSAKVEHPALGPLEVMGTRSWSKGDYSERHRRLDDARPADAEARVAAATRDESEPVDLQALENATPAAFDDLSDSALRPEAAAAAAAEEHEEPAAEVAAAPVAEAEDLGEADEIDDGADEIDDDMAFDVSTEVEEPEVEEPDAAEAEVEEAEVEEAEVAPAPVDASAAIEESAEEAEPTATEETDVKPVDVAEPADVDATPVGRLIDPLLRLNLPG